MEKRILEMTGLAVLLGACSVSIGTPQTANEAPSQSATEQGGGPQSDDGEQQARQEQEEEDRQLEQLEAQQQREKRDSESIRQSQCKADLLALRRERSRTAHTSQERAALSSCPNSGLPPGTYQTPSGLPHVTLQVTDSGCASYEAIAFHEGINTRRVETQHGTREIEYEQGFDCTVGGVLDQALRPYHSRWEGTGCRRKILDVVAEGIAWTRGGNSVAAMANDAGGKRRVTLVRVDSDASQWAEGSPLWKKQRAESDDQARVSVMGAQPAPGQAVGCAGRPLGAPCDPEAGRDWCFDLQAEQSGAE